jgi:hypothetical protein
LHYALNSSVNNILIRLAAHNIIQQIGNATLIARQAWYLLILLIDEAPDLRKQKPDGCEAYPNRYSISPIAATWLFSMPSISASFIMPTPLWGILLKHFKRYCG